MWEAMLPCPGLGDQRNLVDRARVVMRAHEFLE